MQVDTLELQQLAMDLSPEQAQKVMNTTAKKASGEALTKYQEIVRSWRTKPTFRASVQKSSFSVVTDSWVFKMLDQTGAKAHIIRARSPMVRPTGFARGAHWRIVGQWSPYRTRKAGQFISVRSTFDSRMKFMGGAGFYVYPREVHHRGITARDYTGKIVKEMEALLPRLLEDVISTLLQRRK